MPAEPGESVGEMLEEPLESVGEMLARRSTEKAWASLNRGTTEEQRAAFTRLLNEKARKKKRRPWK